MAYVTDILGGTDDTLSSTIVIDNPAHVSNDIIFAVLTQDGGSVTIATATSGWINIGGQVASGASRQAWFYKVCASSSEPNPVFTGRGDNWTYSIFTVRDADTTDPINGTARNDWNATSAPISPALTTTINDNILLLYSWGYDNNKFIFPAIPSDLTYIDKRRSLGNGQIAGYKQQDTAGAVPIITARHENSSEGGNAFVIAVNNKIGGGRARQVKQSVEYFLNSTTYAAPTTILTTLDGSNVLVNSYSNTTGILGNYWGTFNGCTINAAGADEWSGISLKLDSTQDFTDKNYSLSYYLSSVNTNRFGSRGVAFVFSDSLGNWVAYQASNRAVLGDNVLATSHISVGVSTPFDSSGAYDITDITDIVLLVNRANSSTSLHSLRYKDHSLKTDGIFTGGNVNNPINPDFLNRAMSGWGQERQGLVQGQGQGLNFSGIQLGDGIVESYSDFTAQSYEVVLNGDFVQMSLGTLPFIIYASANDTVNLKSCVITTTIRSEFLVHASSSTSATYDFSGSSIIGWDMIWKLGVTCNGSNITDCTVDQQGGSFDSCNFIDTLITSDNLNVITGCSFASTGTGYAVDLGTFAGSSSVAWSNNDIGYAVTNGSTGNETLLVNVSSGQTLTINVGTGFTTPTYNNTGSGTVNIVSGAVIINVNVKDNLAQNMYGALVYIP